LQALAERPKPTLLVGRLTPPPWAPPPDLPGSVIAEALAALPAWELFLAPARHDEIIATIAATFSHYWAAELPPIIEAVALEQWEHLLAPFPSHVIRAACLSWLRDHRLRPSPTEIVALCRREMDEDRETLHRLRLIAAGPPKPPAPSIP
jgi:hypothetical protein